MKKLFASVCLLTNLSWAAQDHSNQAPMTLRYEGKEVLMNVIKNGVVADEPEQTALRAIFSKICNYEDVEGLDLWADNDILYRGDLIKGEFFAAGPSYVRLPNEAQDKFNDEYRKAFKIIWERRKNKSASNNPSTAMFPVGGTNSPSQYQDLEPLVAGCKNFKFQKDPSNGEIRIVWRSKDKPLLWIDQEKQISFACSGDDIVVIADRCGITRDLKIALGNASNLTVESAMQVVTSESKMMYGLHEDVLVGLRLARRGKYEWVEYDNQKSVFRIWAGGVQEYVIEISKNFSSLHPQAYMPTPSRRLLFK